MELYEPFVRAAIAIAAVIALARVNGLRSFSKMSSFDFALTIALGSLLATTISNGDQDIEIGLATIAAVFLVQAIIAVARRSIGAVERLTDNSPILLMDGPEILHDNLRKARVTENDLYGKLREANALSRNEVRAVVFEPTGDISVLHGPVDGPELDQEILTGVEGSARHARA